LHLYFRTPPPADRFFFGDRYMIPLLRRLIRGKKVGGVEKVFINLAKGLKELNVDFDINLPFAAIGPGEPVVVLGSGEYAMQGYAKTNPVIAGIGLMTHPYEWPALCREYPVAKYLQHSDWVRDLYTPYFGKEICGLWPAGIDTERWTPSKKPSKKFDLLIYNKIRWNQPVTEIELRLPILKHITRLGLSYKEIVYGHYNETEYFELLDQSKAMLFLCEHESQGFACCEALSMNVPVFAWDQGYWLDANRLLWGEHEPVPATSVPFFDDSCGRRFADLRIFERDFGIFWKEVINGEYKPRAYILKNLTLKKSAEKMLEIINSVYK
jgi:hypothetical protein